MYVSFTIQFHYYLHIILPWWIKYFSKNFQIIISTMKHKKKMMKQKDQTQVIIKVRIQMVQPLWPRRKEIFIIYLLTRMIKKANNTLILYVLIPLEPKLLMDVYILTECWQNYDIIKHVNEDSVHMTYFDPQKYPVSNKFKGEGYCPMLR